MTTLARRLAILTIALALGACGSADDPAGQDHAGHDHAGHDHTGHDHGPATSQPAPSQPAPSQPAASQPAAAGDYPLTTCIVAGEPLDVADGPTVIRYEGREVRFCCESCAETFKKEPAKYLARLDAALKQQAENPPG